MVFVNDMFDLYLGLYLVRDVMFFLKEVDYVKFL